MTKLRKSRWREHLGARSDRQAKILGLDLKVVVYILCIYKIGCLSCLLVSYFIFLLPVLLAPLEFSIVTVAETAIFVLAYVCCITAVGLKKKGMIKFAMGVIGFLTCAQLAWHIYIMVGVSKATYQKVYDDGIDDDEDTENEEKLFERVKGYIYITFITYDICMVLFNIVILFACALYQNSLGHENTPPPDA